MLRLSAAWLIMEAALGMLACTVYAQALLTGTHRADLSPLSLRHFEAALEHFAPSAQTSADHRYAAHLTLTQPIAV